MIADASVAVPKPTVTRQTLSRLLGCDLASLPAIDPVYDAPMAGDGFTRVAVRFAGGLGDPVRGYLFLPNGEGPHPAILGLGSGRTKELVAGLEDTRLYGCRDIPDSAAQAPLRYGPMLARRGYAVLTFDFRYFGERRHPRVQGQPAGEWLNLLTRWGNRELTPIERAVQQKFVQDYHELFGFRSGLLHGKTSVGVDVADIAQARRVLAGRDDVDPERIGIIGHSKGGIDVLFAAPMVEGIAAAVCSCGLSTYEAIIRDEQLHATCLWVPRLLEHIDDTWDLLGLFAPRPFLAVNCIPDAGFPIDGTREAIERARRVYGLRSASDRIALVEDDAPHAFTDRLATAAWEWFDRFLKPETAVGAAGSHSREAYHA